MNDMIDRLRELKESKELDQLCYDAGKGELNYSLLAYRIDALLAVSNPPSIAP